MTFVILQPCCNDASCVDVCPVDCIHPTPDEPGFMTSEMLHIDPDTCIDCGACVDECPVDAIRADHELEPEQDRYLGINANYFQFHPMQSSGYNTVASPFKGVDFTGRRIAVVGSGPAAFYAATELASIRGIEVEMYDRLLTPYGLVRAGVAPDHPGTKAVTDLFRAVGGKKSVRIHLGVEIGSDISHEELLEHHDAVIYATGASNDRRLGIPGEDLPGSHAAAEFVGWYNGHPDYTDRSYDLTSERAVIVGNGNVALDIARVLLVSPAELENTDIADHALEALRGSKIREVIVLGRRGSAQAAYTNPELIGLMNAADIDIVLSADEAEPDATTLAALEAGTAEPSIALKVELAREIAAGDGHGAGSDPNRKRIVLRFCVSSDEILGEESVTSIRLIHNELRTDESGTVKAERTSTEEMLDTGLILRSVGYHGSEIPGVPFDSGAGVIPNKEGRVIDNSGEPVSGTYATGWIKRGPTGVIGTNKKCAAETVRSLLEDIAADRLPHARADRAELDLLLEKKAPDALDFPAWARIDKAEVSAGKNTGRPRVKFVGLDEMRLAAQPPRADLS